MTELKFLCLYIYIYIYGTHNPQTQMETEVEVRVVLHLEYHSKSTCISTHIVRNVHYKDTQFSIPRITYKSVISHKVSLLKKLLKDNTLNNI